MKLYGPHLSNNVFRPLMVAKHVGVEVELVAVSLPAGEHKSDSYRRVNPFGRIPALEDGDFCLFESTAICQYIAAQGPNDIWPDDVKTRARITAWQLWSSAHLVRAVGMIQFNRIFKPMFGMGDPDEAVIVEGERLLEQETAVLEQWLGDGRPWLLGEQMTLADLDAAGQFLHADAAKMAVPDKVRAWVDRAKALPAWSAAAAAG